MLYRTQLRDIAAASLAAAQTIAGNNVFVSRDWPTNVDSYPAILVQAYRERKDSRGRSKVPQFTAVARLSVVGRIQSSANDIADYVLEQFCEQLELAVLTSQPLLQAIQCFSYVETDMGVSAEGRQHIGEVQIDFGLEYPIDIDPIAQSPVGPAIGTPIEQMSVAITEPAGTVQPGFLTSFPQ